MRFIKYLVYFFFFFLLFYLESFQVTSYLSFSQLWKIPLVLFMIWYVLNRKIEFRPRFNKIAYYWGIKNLFNEGMLSSPISNVIETFRFTNFPLLYDTINIYFRDPEKLRNFIIRISQYFILTNIPFLLGIMQSVREGMEFGDEMSFIGIFQKAHSASIVTTFALLVLIHHIKEHKLSLFSKVYNILLIILGTYCLYLDFVRTGYLMFVIGVFILYMPSKIRIRQVILFVVVIFAISVTFYRIMETNDRFQHRILDQNKKGEQRSLGSGRLEFMAFSLEYWAEGNFQELMLGRGLENVKDNLFRKTGQRIFSHNGFVDALAINGIIGLSLFLSFLYFMYRNIRKNKASTSYRLALAMFFCFISFQLTQGGAGFPIDLYMVSILNLANKD